MHEEHDDDLSGLIRTHATRFRASPALEAAVRSEIARQSAAARRPAAARPWRLPAWGFAGAGFACGIIVSAIVLFVVGRPGESGDLETELVNSHIRALMVTHLTDVASSDQHTVKPWFQGKLDYSPPVRDLAGQGFPLVGGRLDYLSGRAVAALIYQRHAHLINVFVWPGSGDDGSKLSGHQGYNVLHWCGGGMQYWVVSDVNSAELQTLGSLLH